MTEFQTFLSHQVLRYKNVCILYEALLKMALSKSISIRIPKSCIPEKSMLTTVVNRHIVLTKCEHFLHQKSNLKF